MIETKERYLTDEQGNRLAVILDVPTYERLVDALDELEAIRAFDAANASGEEPVPFEEAVRRIENGR